MCCINTCFILLCLQVYLVGNTAPGVDERSHHLPLQNGLHEIHNKRFVEMVRKYHSIIAGQFFGHRHSDTFRVIYNATGKSVRKFDNAGKRMFPLFVEEMMLWPTYASS